MRQWTLIVAWFSVWTSSLVLGDGETAVRGVASRHIPRASSVEAPEPYQAGVLRMPLRKPELPSVLSNPSPPAAQQVSVGIPDPYSPPDRSRGITTRTDPLLVQNSWRSEDFRQASRGLAAQVRRTDLGGRRAKTDWAAIGSSCPTSGGPTPEKPQPPLPVARPVPRNPNPQPNRFTADPKYQLTMSNGKFNSIEGVSAIQTKGGATQIGFTGAKSIPYVTVNVGGSGVTTVYSNKEGGTPVKENGVAYQRNGQSQFSLTNAKGGRHGIELTANTYKFSPSTFQAVDSARAAQTKLSTARGLAAKQAQTLRDQAGKLGLESPEGRALDAAADKLVALAATAETAEKAGASIWDPAASVKAVEAGATKALADLDAAAEGAKKEEAKVAAKPAQPPSDPKPPPPST